MLRIKYLEMPYDNFDVSDKVFDPKNLGLDTKIKFLA